MIRHVLKNGKALPDITGHTVKLTIRMEGAVRHGNVREHKAR